jgi:serine/threonine protein kinase
MEFVTGQTFGEWVQNKMGELDYERLKKVLLPLLDAIEYLHDRHLMHRDIAPDNILMREDGAPILIDFGTLKQHVLGEETNLEGTELHDPSAVVAKKFFSPPEQFSNYRKSELGSTADIYSLGATIYDVLAGRADDQTRHLVPATDRASNVVALGGRPMPPLHEVTRIPLPRGFCDAVDVALNLSPRNRPQSIASFRDMLFSGGFAGIPVVQQPPASDPQPKVPSQPQPDAQTDTSEGGVFRWGRMAGMGTAAAFAAAAGVFVFIQARDSNGDPTPVPSPEPSAVVEPVSDPASDPSPPTLQAAQIVEPVQHPAPDPTPPPTLQAAQIVEPMPDPTPDPTPMPTQSAAQVAEQTSGPSGGSSTRAGGVADTE